MTNVDRILENFSHLVEELLLNEVEQLNNTSEIEVLNSLEASAAKDRQKSRHIDVARIPLKITVRDLKSNPKTQRIFDSFASNIYKLDYGAKHISLTVGDVVLEWGKESLVVPHPEFEPKNPSIKSDTRDISTVCSGTAEAEASEDSLLPIEKEVDHMLYCSSEKKQIFVRLAEVISLYNVHHYYDTRRRNCQTFVKDALSALGITDKVAVTLEESEDLRQLRTKKSKNIPDSFAKHEDLDIFLWNKSSRCISELDRDSLEFLQLIYLQFHGDKDCHLPDCRLFMVEEALDERDINK